MRKLIEEDKPKRKERYCRSCKKKLKINMFYCNKCLKQLPTNTMDMQTIELPKR